MDTQPPYVQKMSELSDSANEVATWRSISAFREAHLVPVAAAAEGEAGAAAAQAVAAQAGLQPAAQRAASSRAKRGAALQKAIVTAGSSD